jgi:RHS repeat-associated protein
MSVGAPYVSHSSTERRYSIYSPALQLLAETATTSASAPPIAHEYIWFGGEPLAQVETTTGAMHWYFNDHLGAPVLTTSSTGSIDWRVEREPYGERYSTRVGADRHQPLGLPGQEYDASSDRQYNVFRWYRSSWGRYTQNDPLLSLESVHALTNVLEYPLSPGFRQPRWYIYALSSPLRYSDPRGLKACPDCEDATPLPSTSAKCDAYGDAKYDPFFTVSLKCFCKCAGDSTWSKKVRGCLACEFEKGTDVTKAHIKCYDAAGPDMPKFTLGKCLAACYVVPPVNPPILP